MALPSPSRQRIFRRPPKTLDELLDMLAATVPEFAAAVRDRAQLKER